MYITITSFNDLHGEKPLKLNGIVKLVKEPDNKYDTEAVRCEMRYFGKIGYVANSTRTVIKGTMSAGRLYDKINDEYFASINEVSKRLNVPAHTLRYWEKQFPVAIRPTTGAGGRRYYRTETVHKLIVIKDLFRLIK